VTASAGLGTGFRIGHWTDADAGTGCTVILPPRGNVASCDIRGSAPGSRELEILHPDRRLTEVHAVLLTGGSAFGLAAAQGVVDWLEARGIGYETPVATVPIVPAAVIFDLRSGAAAVRPGPDSGRAACDVASETAVTGRVGAGTGATVGKWAGFEHAVPGGLGIGAAGSGDQRVTAMAVVNAVGDVLNDDGTVLAGTTSPEPSYETRLPAEQNVPTNTVLALVAVEADLDKRDVRWLAARGSDGVTKTLRPAHTRYDGDVTFAIAAPEARGGTPDLDALGALATEAVASAVRNAVAR
jgi:L-aminopeptidase/D-esterase-like protein